MNIWLQALKEKIRFDFKGSITTEDLFKLNFTDLDTIYQKLAKELQDLNGGSLLNEQKNKNVEKLQLKLDIVKGVFDIKKTEQAILQNQIKNEEERQRIMEIINKKEDEALSNLSIEELKERLDKI